jgi:hypothetical protein
MSRKPLMPSNLLLRRFFLAGDAPPAPLPSSSDGGSVTVLPIASPQRHCLLTVVPSSGICSSAAMAAEESGLFSMSCRSDSCRWLRSFRPVDARQPGFGGNVSGCVANDEGVMGSGGGFDSSPASVMARSRLLRRFMLSLAVASGVPEGVLPVTAFPPPSSMSSAAHSQDILYLESMV